FPWDDPLSPSAVAVGAPEPAVDPELGQLEGVGIGLTAGLESGAAPAEDGNPFFLFRIEHDRRARRPLARLGRLGFHLDAMMAVGFGAHDSSRMKDKGSALQMLTLPPLSLIPSCASASTTGISAPSALPTSAASGKALGAEIPVVEALAQ